MDGCGNGAEESLFEWKTVRVFSPGTPTLVFFPHSSCTFRCPPFWITRPHVCACVCVHACVCVCACMHVCICISLQAFFHTPEEEISLGPALWLWDYLRRSNQGETVYKNWPARVMWPSHHVSVRCGLPTVSVSDVAFPSCLV